MSSWNEPKSLQMFSASAVTDELFKKLKRKVRNLTRQFDSNCATQEDTIALIKILLSEIERWWTSIPGASGKLGVTLQTALDDTTELPPRGISNPIDHVTSLVLKLLFLDSIFIHKDYSNNCGMCLIPFALENITCALLKNYRFKLKKLIIYGAMYPSIVETIIENCCSIRYLAVSQVNLSDNLMDSIGKCSQLEVLHFMHNYIWLSVSTPALCRGFFNQMEEDAVSNNFISEQRVSVSFTNLKVLDIGACMNRFVISFYRWLLYYYDLSVTCLDWKTCILEDDRKFSTEKLIFPLIRKRKMLHLESLYLNADFLSSLTLYKANLIAEFMPNVKQLCVDCNLRNPYSNNGNRAGENLKELGKKFKNISKLYFNVSAKIMLASSIVEPFLNDFGNTLSTLTITSEYQGQTIQLNILKNILTQCPNIKHLKLLFLTRYSIRYEEGESLRIPMETKLTELWFHEVSPWDVEQGLSHEVYTKNWLLLLESLIQSSPSLQILSVTACESISELLLKLSSKVDCFHLHIKDGCEWNVDDEVLISMIKKFPSLKKLYLEELDGETFWKVKCHFAETGLDILWGNLGGWPRT